ncbi:LysR family transcriptional regulator [Colwellia psychrerythraea]|uniref:Transcriptional regulator, LysR family n=1 Tax=Colwellia psychrerythraea TaxID=28229 RepID=A0A099KGD6_COLPS|nr:LysR family transcriptional regulator [Colwellia psychrerythraea]KGJ88623.1 transcriptional regulator, LysR family [Colwellia psychrerythraea]
MNLSYLQTFLTVAEEGSFTKAAEGLSVSKGLVSRHVSHLETTLNAKLFHRTTRRIALTEVGEELLSKAKQIQLLASEAEIRVRDITQEFAGNLKVTAPFEFGRALCRHVIPSFIQQHPQINLILDFGPIKREIVSGDFDIAFRAYDELPDDVVGKELGFIRNVLVCSKDFAQHNEVKSIHDLHRCRFVLNGQDERWNQLILVKNDEHYQIEVSGNLSSNTYSSILQLAEQGLGIACLPYYQVEELIKTKKLIHLLPDWAVKIHKLSLIYAQRRITPRKLVTFNLAVKNWLESNNLYLISKG